MSPSGWTPESEQDLVHTAIQEIAARGIPGFLTRVAARVGRGVNAVDHKLRRLGFKAADHTVAAPAPEAAPVDPDAEFRKRVAALDPDDAILREFERRTATIRSELTATRRKLAESDRQRTVVDELVDVIRETVTPIPYVPAPARDYPANASIADAVVCLTDEHSDELIHATTTWGLERYDFNIFRARLARWTEIIQGYASRWLPGHKFERLWVFKLGDSVHGDIHDHKYRNHFGNSLRAALACGDAEAQAIAAIVPFFPGGVHVVCVSGNHPRQTKKKDYDDPHDNLDFVVASQIATRLQNHISAGAVTVHAPRSWTAYVEVQGHLCALNHGDDTKGTWGIPWYGFSRKENRVQSLVAKKDARVDFFFYGHYHTDVGITDNDARGVHSGAFTYTDGYSLNKVGGGSEPQQTFLAIDGQFGRILEVPIFLREPAAEEAVRAGAWDPPFGSSTVLDVLGTADRIAERRALPVITAATPSSGLAHAA